jgi:hypothetical protein
MVRDPSLLLDVSASPIVEPEPLQCHVPPSHCGILTHGPIATHAKSGHLIHFEKVSFWGLGYE